MRWKFWQRDNPVVEERRLRANEPDYNRQFKYADNGIKTSKYNIITFLPFNLFEQFQRVANLYFLFLVLLQFIPEISSVSVFTTLVPLLVVLAFSAVKDGYDDVLRHISDRTVNGRKTYLVRDGKLAEEQWSNVQVGNVIRLMSNQFIPADVIVLSSSEPHGICFVETKDLDGETNLKTRMALGDTLHMEDGLDAFTRFHGEVICEPPNNKLDKFQGQLVRDQKTSPITNDNILLRGCTLRNTRWCYGLVIFTGKETKLMMNSGKTKFKRTSIDRFLNVLILGIVLLLVCMCLISAILCGVWEWTTGNDFRIFLPWHSLIRDHEKHVDITDSIFLISFLVFISYFILLNTLVPSSLYVSVEIIRFVHSLWINFDCEMVYEKDGNFVAAQARTTSLNEELGQVQYIFSDKTGTLTQNIMTFKKASINGVSYGDLGDTRTLSVDFSCNEHYEPSFKFYDERLPSATQDNVADVREFWLTLALCHTVMPERDDRGQLVYQAQSPDEAALTSAARNFGFVFLSRTPTSITIKVDGEEETYRLLSILDFNNDRKRMSVIVCTPEGSIRLYCKGADMMIMDRLASTTSQRLRAVTSAHLDEFAEIGLRTLCLAYKDIDEEYFEDWEGRVNEASVDLANRDQKLDELYEEMEQDLTLIGATAIEDKLQDGVPQTIAKLAEAGIKIWVLTGDKTETAINIAYSCNLLSDDMRHISVIEGTNEKEVEVQLKDTRRIFNEMSRRATEEENPYLRPDASASPEYENLRNVNFVRNGGLATIEEDAPLLSSTGTGGVAMVVNGDSLFHALTPRLERSFLDLACSCKAVICCRVTPLQKALVVDLVKKNTKAVTLSVGDGANDVSMIKTAHIGVGISGQEGMQAVLSSDYSIAQFRYLERLLLVHGRWSYIRMCKFLRYFFYKNFAFTLTHFWYSFFNGYSAQSIFDSLFITSYNLIFTAMPVIAMGVFDQDASAENSLRFPKLYRPGQSNALFNARVFLFSVLHGLFSSCVIFFVSYGALHNEVEAFGKELGDWSSLSFTTFTSLVIVVTLQIALDTSFWTPISHIVIWASILLYIAAALILYEAIGGTLIIATGSSLSQNVVFRSVKTPQFWFSIILVCAILILPVLLSRFFWSDVYPSFTDRLKAKAKVKDNNVFRPSSSFVYSSTIDRNIPLRRSSTMRRSQRGSLRSGYAFSHSQGFGYLIRSGTLFQSERPEYQQSPDSLSGEPYLLNVVPLPENSNGRGKLETFV